MTKRQIRITSTILVAAVIAVGILGWYKLYRPVPEPLFNSADAQFRYGPIDQGTAVEIPYWIWLVLPRIFPDLLPGPGGYESLGLSWELGEELPIGFSRTTAGYPRVATNCALCHTVSYRTRERESPQFVELRWTHTSTLDGYLRFLTDAANDQRFDAKTILAQMDYVYSFSWLDKLLYRYWIIPSTKEKLLALRDKRPSIHAKDAPGWPPLESRLMSVAAARYPFSIDETSAAQGRALYAAHCESCHRPGREARNGSTAPSLENVWLRSPYLRNSSVPNLRELLKPDSQRVGVFYRGYDVYDADTGGFISQGPQAEHAGIRFDVSGQDNNNRGHDYGTQLTGPEKDALIEYLKTL